MINFINITLEFCPCCEKPVYRRVSDSGVENY